MAGLLLPEGAEVMHLHGPGAVARPVLRAVPSDYGPYGAAATLARAAAVWQSVRLLVLIDARTGAGAEALAGVLREQRQARLIGQTSFGAAVIEQVVTLDDAGSMRIAVAEMATPAGLRWQGRGIVPDELLAAPPPGPRWEYGDLAGDVQLQAVLAGLGLPTTLPATPPPPHQPRP
ncbi:MAG: hypothetical protein RLZZ584_4336 [Pseudomonadota bacterium]